MMDEEDRYFARQILAFLQEKAFGKAEAEAEAVGRLGWRRTVHERIRVEIKRSG